MLPKTIATKARLPPPPHQHQAASPAAAAAAQQHCRRRQQQASYSTAPPPLPLRPRLLRRRRRPPATPRGSHTLAPATQQPRHHAMPSRRNGSVTPSHEKLQSIGPSVLLSLSPPTCSTLSACPHLLGSADIVAHFLVGHITVLPRLCPRALVPEVGPPGGCTTVDENVLQKRESVRAGPSERWRSAQRR